MNVSKNRSLRTLAWSVIAGVLAVGVVVADPADHQMRLDPMELGVSSGNIQHIDGNSCCGGTAGALRAERQRRALHLEQQPCFRRMTQA